MMPDLTLILAAFAVLLGSAVQGSVGFGVALLAAPAVMLIDPSLMPGSVLIVSTSLAATGFVQERRHVEWSGLGWALAGRAVGTAFGAYLVVIASARVLATMVGVVVLAAVALTSRAVRIPLTPGSLAAAGVVSGVTGTAASIGGPPIALLMQHEPGRKIRANLAAFFLVGASVSLAALAIAGRLPPRTVFAGLAMVPFMVLGFALAQPLRRHLDVGRTRHAVLAVAAASAVALLIRSLF